jgi:hypothetical protein
MYYVAIDVVMCDTQYSCVCDWMKIIFTQLINCENHSIAHNWLPASNAYLVHTHTKASTTSLFMPAFTIIFYILLHFYCHIFFIIVLSPFFPVSFSSSFLYISWIYKLYFLYIYKYIHIYIFTIYVPMK